MGRALLEFALLALSGGKIRHHRRPAILERGVLLVQAAVMGQ
jgi:hypothetical protein